MLKLKLIMRLWRHGRFVLVIAFLLFTNSAFAISFGKPGGDWPQSWPKELDPLRKQAWTWEHGFGGTSYDIPFANRKEFELAWPHIMKLKNKGASITLRRGPRLRILKNAEPNEKSAGVIIRLPRKGSTEGELADTRIELIVDGDIVDLNRVRLPIHTPLVDMRFEDQ